MNDLAEIIALNKDQIRAEWVKDMGKALQRTDLMSKAELDEHCRIIVSAVVTGVRAGGTAYLSSSTWATARELLQEISAMPSSISPADVSS